jgi:membrane fusion protein
MTAIEYFPDEAARKAAVEAPQPERTAAAGQDEGRAGPLLGRSIHVRQNFATTIMAALFASMTLALLGALWLGHLAKSETVRGMVTTITGSSRIEAPRAAVIKELFVHQGDTVAVGDRIATLRLATISTDGETTDAKEMRILEQRRVSLAAEVRRNAAAVEQARSEESATAGEQGALAQAFDSQERTINSGLDLERASVAKLTGLVRGGYATNDMLDQHRHALFQYEHELADVRLRRIETAQQSANHLRQLRATINDRATARADAENALGAIDLRVAQIKADESLDLVAQTFGKVLTIAGKTGDSVSSGQLVAAIGNPSDEPLIVLDAPAKAIGLARAGQRVVLKYDAFPFKTFGVAYGTITSISASAIGMAKPDKEEGAGESADPREKLKQAIYRVEVKPESRTMRAYGDEQPIAIGSTLTAEIVVERRRLIDWVLDPIRAMAGRL